VLEAGPGVTRVKGGERVLLSWMKGPGADVPGTVYKSALGNVNAGGITTFSQHAVISENRLTVLPADVDLREAAILGCAVPTGLGAVINTAGAKSGQSAVIFGVGGIGLCAVAGAAIAGCNPIVAIDLKAEKLKTASSLGATHCVQVNGDDVVAALKEIVKGGFDIAVEASGRPQAMEQALQSVRNQGGVAVVLGNARFGEKLQIDPRELNNGKQLRGSWGGDNKPERDFPRYFELLSSGKLNVKPLMDKSYPLASINQAIDDLERGSVTRPLIEMAIG